MKNKKPVIDPEWQPTDIALYALSDGWSLTQSIIAVLDRVKDRLTADGYQQLADLNYQLDATKIQEWFHELLKKVSPKEKIKGF